MGFERQNKTGNQVVLFMKQKQRNKANKHRQKPGSKKNKKERKQERRKA